MLEENLKKKQKNSSFPQEIPHIPLENNLRR